MEMQETIIFQMMNLKTDGIFNMRKLVYIVSVIIVSVMLNGCRSQWDDIDKNDGKSTHTLMVNAYSDDETKVSIDALPGDAGYLVSWDVGDILSLFESANEEIGFYSSSPLAEGDIVGGKASFSFEIEDKGASSFDYIAAYPWGIPKYDVWEDESDEMYTKWADIFDYEGEYVPPHMVVDLEFPIYQTPTADSYDPCADLLISKQITSPVQLSGEVMFRFARVGAIVKVTLKGLDDYIGKNIVRAAFLSGESYKGFSIVSYDPVLQKLAYDTEAETGTHMNYIEFEPQNLIVKEDGTADLWMRIPAGTISDWFRVELAIKVGEDEVLLSRYVDLTSLIRSLVFNDGKMSAFSVGNFVLTTVEDVSEVNFAVNAAKDGFTATWSAVENAVGYNCFLTNSSDVRTDAVATDNGDGTWSVQIPGGLAKDTYYLNIKPIPADGYGLIIEDYGVYEVKVGVPYVYHFAHDTFGNPSSCEEIEDTDGEYIIPVYSPGKVRFKGVERQYDKSWQTLAASGPWFFYSTEPLEEIHSIEIYSKDNSHLNFKVYASSAPNEHTVELEGVVVETDHVQAGSGSFYYDAVHRKVRYTFPEGYKYYTFCGEIAGIMMTSQYSYVYYYKSNITVSGY